MVDAITVVNVDTGNELLMNKSAGSYILETNGIKWGEVSAEHNSYANLMGVGEVITSSKLQPRTISVIGRVCPIHTNKELAVLYDISTISELTEKKLEEIEQAKQKLSQLINPLQYLRIITGDYYIQGKPTSSVTFSNLWKENNEVYCKFTFSLNCNDPMFHSPETSNQQIASLEGGFHFPISIPKPNGMRYGIRRISQLVNVANNSDISLGGAIYMKATGIVTNPSITNVNTQETILINKTLQAGEVVKIDTIERKVTGALDGENFESYFQYWVFTNSWLQFAVGDTLFGFAADSGTYKNLYIWIELNKSFYSMENQ